MIDPTAEIMDDQAGAIDVPLQTAELLSFESADSSEPVPPADIIAYNEVRSCADLFRLYTSKQMEVQPDFQREIVWRNPERSRFIDSLVKQLPIPSMCFSLESRTQRWKVIDGLQRMTTIINFLGLEEWRLAPLDDIHPLLRGKTNVTLRNGNAEEKVLFSAVENVTIPVTVIRCDYEKREHMRYLFTIFHRLNSGGVRLNNQEIRNCIYTGTFNNALKEFDKENADWQVVKSRIWGSVNRFRSVEILLRVLAFSSCLNEYDGNLAAFLNQYMHSNIDMVLDEIASLRTTLSTVARIARATLEPFTHGKLSLAIVEAVLVGINVNRRLLQAADPAELRVKYQEMLTKPSFAEGARYAVSSADNVGSRLRDAITSFGNRVE